MMFMLESMAVQRDLIRIGAYKKTHRLLRLAVINRLLGKWLAEVLPRDGKSAQMEQIKDPILVYRSNNQFHESFIFGYLPINELWSVKTNGRDASKKSDCTRQTKR